MLKTKWLSLPLLAFFIFSSYACRNEQRISYWENGLVKSELSYRKGVLHGKSSWYGRSGYKQMEANYDNGELQGRLTKFYPNGKVLEIIHYQNGLKQGVAESYTKAGKPEKHEIYINDTLHGPFKLWHYNGRVQIEGHYNKGLYDGRWLYFNDMGDLVGIGTFDMGKGTLTYFQPNGQTGRKISYENNQKNGWEFLYDTSGNLIQRNYFQADTLVSGKDIN